MSTKRKYIKRTRASRAKDSATGISLYCIEKYGLFTCECGLKVVNYKILISKHRKRDRHQEYERNKFLNKNVDKMIINF